MSQEHIRNIFAALDALHIDEFSSYFTQDGQMRTGNAPPLIGRDTIRNELGQAMRATVKGLHHEIIGLWEEGDVAIVEASVNYSLLNGSVITLPAVTILRLSGDLLRDYRVYMDIGPVLAQG